MTVEIRELVIKTHITDPDRRAEPPVQAEDLRALKQQIIQECLKAMRNSSALTRFER